MGRPQRNEVPGLTFHVYCRGNRGSPTFEDDSDRLAFLEKLRLLTEQLNIAVLAFCLMPNHFHLCVRTAVGGGSLSKLMQRLNLWHARWFNWKHGLRGRLNEGRYKAKVVDSERYLQCLVRYIHQNPVRAALAECPNQWRFSSHSAYLGRGHSWVSTSEVLESFGGIRAFRAFVEGARAPQEDLDCCRFKRAKTIPRPAGQASPSPATGIVSMKATPSGVHAERSEPELRRLALELRQRGLSVRKVARTLGRPTSEIARLLAPDPLEALRCREEEAVYLRVA